MAHDPDRSEVRPVPRTWDEAYSASIEVMKGMCRRQASWWCPYDDLLSEAMIGLWKAWQTWNPQRGCWNTWAGQCVRSVLMHYLRDTQEWKGLICDDRLLETVTYDPFGNAWRSHPAPELTDSALSSLLEQGLTAYRIGLMYRVHKSTVAWRAQKLRQA